MIQSTVCCSCAHKASPPQYQPSSFDARRAGSKACCRQAHVARSPAVCQSPAKQGRANSSQTSSDSLLVFCRSLPNKKSMMAAFALFGSSFTTLMRYFFGRWVPSWRQLLHSKVHRAVCQPQAPAGAAALCRRGDGSCWAPRGATPCAK